MHTLETVGIIMDGNRRFAKAQGLSSIEGHRLGLDKLKEVAVWAKEAGIKNLIAYTFSTENWRRAPEEVTYLMGLFQNLLMNEVEHFVKENIRIRFIGNRERFAKNLIEGMKKAEEATAKCTGITVVLAVSYGGRQELIDAMQSLVKQGLTDITEAAIKNVLYAPDIPDPDLIIRTGGEKRLSNFLPWQSTYSELFFVDTFWPAFTKEEFLKIITEYTERERRMGK